MTAAIPRGMSRIIKVSNVMMPNNDGATYGQNNFHQHIAGERHLLRCQHGEQTAPGVKHSHIFHRHDGHAEILGEEGDDRAQHEECEQDEEKRGAAQNQRDEVFARMVE